MTKVFPVYWGIFLNCLKLILSINMTQSNFNKASKRTTKPVSSTSFKIKLVAILLLVLITSSGPLYYFQVPADYYFFLGISVLLVWILIIIAIYMMQGKADIFSEQPKGIDGINPKEIPNPNLERILKAEKRYENKRKKAEKRLKEPEESTSATPSKIKIDRAKASRRSRRIGSIPLEESELRDRVKLQTKSTKQKSEKEPEKVTTFLCPSCGSKELYYESGLISGYKYHCKDCDYIGSFVIEKDFKID